MRTTLDIDAQILRELKRIQKKEGTSLERLVSNLLAQALKAESASATPSPPVWIAKQMVARVNFSDKEAVHRAMTRVAQPRAGAGAAGRKGAL